MARTPYYVLREENGGWFPFGEAVASSARGAIHQVTSRNEDPEFRDGEYVAVPVRSWQPMTVKATVQIKLEIS